MRDTTLKDYYNEDYFKRNWKMNYRPSLARGVKAVLKYKPEKVLDVGCGEGLFVKNLRERGINAVGIDFSDYAGKLIPDHFIQADARLLPFSDKLFDVVISRGLFEHFPEEEIDKAYSEMTRVGKKVLAEICFKEKDHAGRILKEHLTIKPREWWEKKLPNCEVIKLPYEKTTCKRCNTS